MWNDLYALICSCAELIRNSVTVALYFKFVLHFTCGIYLSVCNYFLFSLSSAAEGKDVAMFNQENYTMMT